MFGLERDRHEATYEGYMARVHPDDVGLVNEWVAAALGGLDRFEGDNRIIRPGGELVWVHSRGEVVRDESGAPVRMRGTAHDITTAKLAVDALAESTARYRLLERMATAANEASSFTEALQSAVDEICAHTGWSVGHAYLPDNHDGGALVSSGIWHVEEPERFEALRRATAAASFRVGQGVVGAQLGGTAPVWVSDATLDPTHVPVGAAPELGVRAHIVFPVRLADETVAVLEFFSTDALEADQALLDTFGQVGTQLSRVAERQRAAAELATARDAALEASRLKSQFLATMSHEIRTPMNGVVGLTGLLLRTSLTDRQRQYAEGVEAAGAALLAIINNILDFSKIEAGKVELEVVDFDLVAVVEEAAALVADPARRKGLELAAYCYPGLPTGLRGDPSRLRQVLVNLVSNAVKFTEHGEVVLRARSVEESAEDVVVRFEVVDTGIGVAKADQERLFEPFSQADSSTTRRFGGTGLGLAISRQLVEAMGGELGVHSELGSGSTFWFTVRFRRAAGAVPSQVFQHLLHGLRALVVDDNDTNRLILREQLGAWDMRADLAEDGTSALERLGEAAERDEPYDLALLDVCMDGMDGLELARRISAQPTLATTRLVLLTSTDDVGAEDVRQAGIAACLTKPVRVSELYDCLMRLTAPVLEARQPAPAVAQPTDLRGHLLVVEDNAINQIVALGILGDLGYSADVVTNGLEALEALARADYAAVLMDCEMPEMDGYAATGEVRRREGGSRHTPIIAMTAGVVEGDRERCLAAGMDDYIAKPVTPEQVDVILARWVGEAASETLPTPATIGPADADTTDATVDHHRLDVLRRMGTPDGSLLARMVDAFLDEAPGHVANLREAVHRADSAGVRRVAHRLRGAAANLGAPGVADRCSQLEELGCAGRLSEAFELLTPLEAELDHAGAALRDAVAPRRR